MESLTYEGVVEGGRIRLDPDVQLPEKAKVIVLVRDPKKTFHWPSPRLANRQDVAHFKMKVEVRKADDSAGL